MVGLLDRLELSLALVSSHLELVVDLLLLLQLGLLTGSPLVLLVLNLEWGLWLVDSAADDDVSALDDLE